MLFRIILLLIMVTALFLGFPYLHEAFARHRLAVQLEQVDPDARTALDSWSGDLQSFMEELALRCSLTKDPESKPCGTLRAAADLLS